MQDGRLRIAEEAAEELSFDVLNVSAFVLEGPKELLRQIEEQHNRHYDEIAGIATVPPPPADSDAKVETYKKGPVRVTAGRRDETAYRVRNAPQPITLKVASLTHISEGCVARP